MHITGSCHCGRIRFEAEIDPSTASVCNCADCQALSGSPWRASVRARAADVRVKGEPKVYVKTADSGRPRGQAFCSDCGSPLYSFAPGGDGDYMIRLGGIDQRAALRPRMRIWCDSALPWSQDISDLPGKPRD